MPKLGDEIHVWHVFSEEVRDPRTLARYEGLLSPDERARRDRFVFEKDRHQFLVTRGMIRSLLGRYLDADPAACGFAADEYGRPSLVHPADAAIAFNISHTGGLVACAIAREAEIGIDVEDASREVGPELARRFFSPEEADVLDELAGPARTARFFEYWTLKEAYMKARGMGLSLPLDGFSIQPGRDGFASIRFAAAIDDDPDTWQFAHWKPSPRHQLAVAVRTRGTDRAIRRYELRVE